MHWIPRSCSCLRWSTFVQASCCRTPAWISFTQPSPILTPACPRIILPSPVRTLLRTTTEFATRIRLCGLRSVYIYPHLSPAGLW
ncbi:hypothetical protein FKM82_023207 [Ascaphus truei]